MYENTPLLYGTDVNGRNMLEMRIKRDNIKLILL